MPKFFFHLSDDAFSIADVDGKDLPSVDAARAYALTITADVIAEDLKALRPSINVNVAIEDQHGDIIAKISTSLTSLEQAAD